MNQPSFPSEGMHFFKFNFFTCRTGGSGGVRVRFPREKNSSDTVGFTIHVAILSDVFFFPCRFTPDNFRPYGWAENAPFPDTGTPVEHLDFRSNRLPIGHADRRPFVYFTLAASGFTFLSVVRGIAVKAVYYLWPSRAAFAAGVIEVDTRPIQPGQNFVAKWQGKPVFIKRRTDDEQQMAVRDDALVASMRDPQLDSDRTKKPEWLVIVGVCTHLGCVPFSGMGEYNGWFCPCHGSHYDLSGRIRKGPAPANMKVPKHTWLNDFMVKIG